MTGIPPFDTLIILCALLTAFEIAKLWTFKFEVESKILDKKVVYIVDFTWGINARR